MKKQTILIITLLLCVIKYTLAQVVEVGGIYYTIEDAVASVTESDNGNLYAGDITIPASITVDGNEYTVKKIGRDAFGACTDLTSVVLPNTIEEIEDYAFVFCTNLKNITLPDNLSSIGYAAFYRCHTFTKIEIPKNVASIQPLAFAGCYNVKEVVVDKENTHYDNREGCNAIITTATNALLAGFSVTTIPDGIVGISKGAFYDMFNINMSGQTLIIPSSVLKIDEYAFYQCWRDIKISEGVEYIGDYAFWNSMMTEIIVPNSVKYIGDYAFNYNQNATKIHIGSGVEHIGQCAFTECFKVNEMTVDKDNPYYTSYDEYNLIVENATKTIIAACDNSRMPGFIEAIGEEAYAQRSLNEIIIEPTVKEIRPYAFYACRELKSVYSQITDPFPINVTVFRESGYDEEKEGVFTSATLYVPLGTREKYQNTEGWQNFSQIEEYDFTSNIKTLNEKKQQATPIYNINGQRVGLENRGLIIKDGKKIVVK